MNWFKKYKIVKISDIHYDIMKRKCLFEWEVYRSFFNKHQAECTLYRLNTRFSPVFTHYCSIKPKNKEYVIDHLMKMGYITSCTFDARQKYIYTSQNGYIYSTNDDIISKLTANKYDTLYGIQGNGGGNIYRRHHIEPTHGITLGQHCHPCRP